jgi:hypothetical protein
VNLTSKRFLSLINKNTYPADFTDVGSTHTSPNILIPSLTSWTQPLSSSSRAVMGCSGVDTRRPWSTQCCNLSRFTGAYSLVFLDSFWWSTSGAGTLRVGNTLVIETPLRNQLCDGGLPTFEAGFWTRARSSLLSLMATTRGASVAGSLASTNPFLLWHC